MVLMRRTIPRSEDALTGGLVARSVLASMPQIGASMPDELEISSVYGGVMAEGVLRDE
jgi:hypothetical protein